MIYLVGLGPGDPTRLPPQAFALLTGGLPVFLRTARHPTLSHPPLQEAMASVAVTALDDEYESNRSFEDTYEAIVARVLRAAQDDADLVYAVPGHPLVGETTAALLLTRAKPLGIPVKVIGAPSFVDACLEAIGEAITGDLHVVDALSLTLDAPVPPPALQTGGPLLLYQVHSRDAASLAKLALMQAGYPDEWEVQVIRSAGLPDAESVRTVPLFELDRDKKHDHLTSVWVPPLPSEQKRPDFAALVRVMSRLRHPENGCPWDLKQTHASLRHYVLEEAYEVADAIDEMEEGGDTEHLTEELGDLLLQVVFHAQLGSEEGTFDIGDVCQAIVSKLIRRHPHIFGDVKADDAETVLSNWQQIKAEERGGVGPASILDSVGRTLPALALALETSRRVVKVGFEWPELHQIVEKVEEELQELKVELEANNTEAGLKRIEAELGDVLFTLVNLGRRLGIDAETALRRQVARFTRRFQYIEESARAQSIALETLGLEQMEALWQQAKQQERTKQQT